MAEHENRYHLLRPRFKGKDKNISKTVVFVFSIMGFKMMKPLDKTFIIKIFARINVFKKV